MNLESSNGKTSPPLEITPGKEADWIECLVRSQIINNWESQDEPEHLRTIRNRLLYNSQRVIPILYEDAQNKTLETPAGQGNYSMQPHINLVLVDYWVSISNFYKLLP